jgi:clan AA aspartic protease (TIGR02281 family)
MCRLSNLPLSPIAWLGCLLTIFFVTAASAKAEDSAAVSVKGDEVHLYAHPDDHSDTIAKLPQGEKLTLFASTLGRNDTWYMVKTQKGLLGWVRSSDVQGKESLEKIFKETAAPLPMASLPARSAPSTASLANQAEVSIEMNGANIVVPVLVNGTLKSYMMIDTGATYTVVTPRIAKRLGLKLDRFAPRVTLVTASGYITAPLAEVPSLKVGNAEVRPLQVVVHDFLPPPPIEGLLGLNFLSRFHTSIDYRRQRLTLAPR